MFKFLKKSETCNLLLILLTLGLVAPASGICSEALRCLQVNCKMEDFSQEICQKDRMQSVCVISSHCCKGLEMGRDGIENVLTDSVPLHQIFNNFGYAPNFQQDGLKRFLLDSDLGRGFRPKFFETHSLPHNSIPLTLAKSSLLC